MILQIKRGNRVIAESADFSYSPSLQEVRKLTCEVVSVVPIEFKAYNSKSESEYDTVVYNGNTFILYQAPSGDNLNEAGKYKYSLLFYGKEVLLQNVAFLDIVSGTGGEINKIRYTHGGLFQFWGDAKQLAARIEANIESYNASLGAGYTGIGTWTLNVDAEGELTEDMIDITDGINLFEALKNFYDKFYLNYYFSTTANGGIITITDKTRPSVNWTFKQGDGGGAVKVSSSVDTSTPVITRIIPQGGSRNVPPEYKKDAKPADESRYCPYILLPNDSDGNIRYYIDSEYGLKNYGVRGKTISNTFSGIYPSIRGKKLGDLYPSGLPEWDTYKADGEPDPQSGKVAGEGASASTRIDKIIGSTPIKSDDSDSFFIYMTSPGFNLGYKVYEDGDSSDKINDNVQPQYKPYAPFDKYRDFERFDIYGTRAYYDQPVKVTASFSGKMLFSILPIGSDALGKKVKINLRMVTNRVLGQASPLKEVVIGEEGATGMLEIPYDKTALVGYIKRGQHTTVTIRVEFTFDSDVPAGSCKIGFSEEMTCNIHFGNQDGSQDRLYYKYASVTDAVFSMRTGTYTGTEFKINKNGIIPLYGEVNGDTGETEEDVAMFNKGARYKISCYRTDSDNAKLPLYTDGKSPSIAAGTEFVILNIVMPESYVTMAENTLEKAALDYLSRYDHENRTVSLDISSGFVAEHPNLFIDFIEGNMLKVRDDGIGVFDFSDSGQIVDMQLQIQSLEIKYSKENMFPSYSCTIARRKILSFYERLAQENQTASTQNTTNVTLGGSGTGSSGGSSNITNADHAKSAYTLDDDTPVLNWFLSALNDDEAEGIINFLKGLKISGNLINRIVKQGDRDVTYTDEDVMSALRVMVEIENSVEKMKEIFLRKDVADSTKFLLSMFAGAVFGKNGFASGLTGFGAKIFDTGHGEFESMFIRRFLEVPELRYNRVMVTLGDKWRAPGAGIIETVDTGTKTCTLKLEDGEIGAVAVGDICMGIYHNITGNATEDYDDGKGNRRFAGFCTVYFTITEVTGERNETFKYQLRPTSSSWPSSFAPFEMMTFVAYGSFTNTERQTSVYETRTYTRMLWKQNTWEISAANVVLQYGDLSNLNIFGLNMDGYSMYLNNIYMTGIIKQIKPDGTPVQTLNFREEGYIPGVHYDYYDSLSYNGSMWACINEDGSSAAPGSNGDWLEIASKGDTGAPGAPGKDGVSVTNSGPWYSGLVVPKMSIVIMGGSSFLSKVSTTNPPLWCWTDNAGNRFTFNDGGYVLTGEINTDEYELLVQSGKDGSDGASYERVFIHTTTESKPATPSTSQTDDYVPSGWHDDPVGVSSSLPYEWISEREKKNGIWSEFSAPALWAKYGFDGADGAEGVAGTSIIWKGDFSSAPSNPQNGWAYKNTTDKKSYVYQDGQWYQMTIDGIDGKNGKDGVDGKPGEDGKDGKDGVQGIQGCIIRSSEWKTGVTYRNDESLTSGTRYIDIVAKKNTSPSSLYGWDMYMCKSTHTSSSSNGPGNTTYWTAVNEMAPIFTSLIIAKNASIDFVQGNELIIKDSNKNVVAGLTGGSSKEAGTTPVRIWAGGNVPGNAPFRVDQNGNLVATKANITGTITATDGVIGPFSIASGMLSSKILYENETNKYVGFKLSAGQIEFYNERTFARVKIGGNTQFVTIEGIKYDAGIDIQSPNVMIGMHIKTPSIPLFVEGGNIFLHPNNASYVSLRGIVGNWRSISVSTPLNNNDDNVMFINTGNIEVTLPPDVPGHTIYFKRMSGGVRLTGGRILPAPGGKERSSIDLDYASGFVKCMGNHWVMFYCG